MLATSRLLTWSEQATCAAVDAHLDDAHTSVGARLQIDHRQPSPLHTEVSVHARLVAVDGRMLEFEVHAEHGDGQVVGRGAVARMVVDREWFLQRASGRRLRYRLGGVGRWAVQHTVGVSTTIRLRRGGPLRRT